MTKNLLYLWLILLTTALSVGAGLNKCTEDENGLVYCEDVSSQGQAFLKNKRDDEEIIENIQNAMINPKIKQQAPILQKRYLSPDLNKRSLPDVCLNKENDVHYGTVSDFVIFAFDKVEAQSFSLTGKVAAKNSITTNSFSINAASGQCSDGTLKYSLYTDNFNMRHSTDKDWRGKTVYSYNGGGSIAGGLHYGSSYYMPDYMVDNMNNNKCPISKDPYDNLDFDGIEKRMKEISQKLAGLKANANINVYYKTLTLKLNKDIKNYVVEADESIFLPEGGYSFTIEDNNTNLNPEEVSIVVNIKSDSFTFTNASYNLGSYKNRVVWNMPNAKNLKFSSAALYGLYLAPQADIEFNGGDMAGSIICKSLNSSSVSISDGLFKGCIPNINDKKEETPKEPSDIKSTEEEDIEDIIYEVDGVRYRNETVCNSEDVESKEINSDIVFIFDESISMCSYIEALRKKLQSFIDELKNAKANARFAVIGFGGEPRVYSGFTDDVSLVKEAFDKLNCAQGGQESGLEAIRMFLQKSNNFINKAKYAYFDTFTETDKLEWRNGSTKTIILVTDEDSDLPHFKENMNDLQIANLNDMIDVSDYYNKEITDVDKFMAYPASMSYTYDYYKNIIYINTPYSTDLYIEPSFSPARFAIVNDIMSFYRSGTPLVLSEPYQKEVDETAKLLIKENIQLFMLLNDDLQKAQGERVANSQFNKNNPYWKNNLKNIEPKDDSSTITAQYGNPLLDSVSNTKYNKENILQSLTQKKQEKSIQGQLLANGGYCRAFNIKDFVSSNGSEMVNSLYKTIVTTVKNCVVKPVKIIDPTTTIEVETTTYAVVEELQTSISSYIDIESTPIQEVKTSYSTFVEDREVPTVSLVEEIETIYEMPSEFPTVPYKNNTSCGNADINTQEINTDIVFIFDESASMCPYIDAMRSKLNVFVQQLKDAKANARFAIIGFGGKPRIYTPFTSDVSAVEKAFAKLNCKENGQESGLEAIRMFLKESSNFINKIDSIYGQKNFRDIYQLRWRNNSSKTIIIVTDEDSDLPHYEENMNDLQKANFENAVNVKSLDGKDIIASDVQAFGGYPYYLNKNYLPEYKKDIFFEPVFSPASLTTVNGIYTFYRNGSPLVLSEAYQKEVDETANLIKEKGVKLFMLLNDNLADSQGVDVANSQYDAHNPYWVKKGISENDDGSTITAQYGNPLIDNIQNEEYNKEAILSELKKRHQEKSLQGQILDSEDGFCRAFNMKEFTNEDSEKMVELFYQTVVRNVVKCVITPEIIKTETTETITTTTQYDTSIAYEVTSILSYITETPYVDSTTSVIVETVTDVTTEPTTMVEVTTSYIEEIEYPTVPYKNVTKCVDEEAKVKEIDSDIVFIVDESASMCTYIEAMKNKLNVFIDELNKVKANARYAIIGFGGSPRIYSAFTNDVNAVKEAFGKLNCKQGGQESGLEAIRMFIEKSEKFDNNIGNETGRHKFKSIDDISWREDSTRTIIFLTDEDSDLPIYPENRNDLQKTNVNGNINVKLTYDGKELTSTDVDKFMGFPYYMSKRYMPAYADNVYFEPAFSPAVLTTENGYYTFYRSGSPLVLSQAFQTEVDDTAKLVKDNNVQLFLLLNNKLVEAQGKDVSNSHFNALNPYWNEKHLTTEDDSSTVTAQYGNPTIDNIRNVQFNKDEIYHKLVAKNQQNSLQGQILNNGGFCRVFNLEDFTGGDSAMMVELFYKIVVKTVQNCKPLPYVIEEDCLSTENDEALKKLSGFNVLSFSDVLSHNNQIYGRIAARGTVDIGNIAVNVNDNGNYCKDDQEKYAIYAKDFTLDGTYGSIYGGIHYTKSIDLNENTRNLLQNNGCTISDTKDDEIDIKALKRRFVGISNALNGLEPTSEIKTDGYNYFINLDISTKHYIINASKDTFRSEGNGYYLGINNPDNLKPEDITIIINMSGDKIKFGNNAGFHQLDNFKERIIWNMPEAEEVQYNEVGIYGLILAPKAKIIGRGGNIIGKIVAKSLDIERTEIKDIKFGACIPNTEIEEEPITVTVTEEVTSTAIKDFTSVTTATVTDYATITNVSTTEVESTSVSTDTDVSTVSSTATEETTLTTTTVTDYSTSTATATVETTSITTVTDYATVTNVSTTEVESTSVSTDTDVSTVNSTATEETTLTTTTVTDYSTSTATATVETTSITTVTDYATITNVSTTEVESTSVSTDTDVSTVNSTATEETTLTTTTVTDFATVTNTATVETTSTATVTDYATVTNVSTTEVESTSVSTDTDVSTINSTATEETTLTTTTVTDFATVTNTATVETTSTATVTDYATVTNVSTLEVESTSVSTDTDVSTINSTATEETTLTTKTVEETSTATATVEETTTSTATAEITTTATVEVTSTSLSTVVETSTSLSTVVETVYSTSVVEETTSKTTTTTTTTTPPPETTTTVEEVQKSTSIPSDTTSSIESTTSTAISTSTTETILLSDDETPIPTEEVTSVTEEETPSVDSDSEPEPEPSVIVVPSGDEEEDDDNPIGAVPAAIAFAGIAGAAAAAYFKFRQRPPSGNQLADNVFEDNVGMENPLYEGAAGQNENPLYEANLDFDSLEDNLDAFA